MAVDPRGKPSLLVSACLLGVECNHEGRSSPHPAVGELGERARLIPVCPEVAGGLPTPRSAAEMKGGDGADVLAGSARVETADGEDVTDAYLRGAVYAVSLARAVGATTAVLKARSPSCGCGEIYDGSFSRTLADGDGVTAAALREAGVDVGTEENRC